MGQNKEACEIVTEAKAEDYRPVWGFVSLVKPMIQNISMIFHSATNISPASHIYVSDMFIKRTKGPQGSDTRF